MARMALLHVCPSAPVVQKVGGHTWFVGNVFFR
jgi:hypothetical protein